MNVFTSAVLVVATLAMALGLGAVSASFAPLLEALGGSVQTRLHVGITHRAGAPEGALDGAGHELSQPAPMPMGRGGMPAAAELPHLSATGPWISPLYPQNGVTLWDRIRVSSQRDRRDYLLGTAIQVHAITIASTPGPQYDPSHLDGVD